MVAVPLFYDFCICGKILNQELNIQYGQRSVVFMFCHKCGKELPDNAMFCNRCGTSTYDLQPKRGEHHRKESLNSHNNTLNRNHGRSARSKRMLILAGIGVVCVIAVMLTIVLILRKGSDDKAANIDMPEEELIAEVSSDNEQLQEMKTVTDKVTDENGNPVEDLLGYGNLKKGQYVTFGKYEQDNDLDNGEEPIEWEILDNDGERVLLFSRYFLDSVRYNEEYIDVTWETCTLRRWLNNDFFNTAFSEDERNLICSVILPNQDNDYYGTDGGDFTDDKVFCLSIFDIEKYFEPGDYYDKEKHIGYINDLETPPTKYAKDQIGNMLVYSWWLRTPAKNNKSICIVDENGFAGDYYDVTDMRTGVRPAMWVMYRKNENLFNLFDIRKSQDSSDGLPAPEDWQINFKNFIENRDYIQSGDFIDKTKAYHSDISFALHDIDKDGVPELFIFSGYSDDIEIYGALTYVYKYNDGNVSCCGDIPGINTGHFRYGTDNRFPGLFYDFSHTGVTIHDYHYVEDGYIQCKNVSTEEEEYNNDTGYTGNYIETSRINDDELYNAEKNADNTLEFIDEEYYSSHGWDDFVSKNGY